MCGGLFDKPKGPTIKEPNSIIRAKDVDAEANAKKNKQKELAARAAGFQSTIQTSSRGAKGLLS